MTQIDADLKLHRAVQQNDLIETRKWLTRENVNSTLGGDYTPLHWASQEGFIEIAQVLIEMGAGLNIKDDYGFSPLHKAVGENHIELARLLIDKGANVDSRDEGEGTLLSTACTYNLSLMVSLLIDSGAMIDAIDKYGNTPLVYAVIRGHYDIVKLLISKGVNLDIKGIDVDENEEAKIDLIDIAKNHGYQDICDLLNKARNKK